MSKHFHPVPSVLYRKKHDGKLLKYDVIQEIGKGGFGVVYYAIEYPSKKKVALKCTPKWRLESPKIKQKLINEMTIHRSLDHPNIVKFLGTFHDDNYIYFILELCENGNVLEYINQYNRTHFDRKDYSDKNSQKIVYLPESEVIRITKQILNALDYLHVSSRVIHRDIKLQNFLMTKEGTVKLSDFGLSIKFEDMSDKASMISICGTPNYISPEVIDQNSHTSAVDIWGVGVIVFLMLTGRRPFKSINNKKTFDNIRNVHYDWPESPPVSDKAKSFVDSILKRDPLERPSARDLLYHPFIVNDGKKFKLEEIRFSVPSSSNKFAPNQFSPPNSPSSKSSHSKRSLSPSRASSKNNFVVPSKRALSPSSHSRCSNDSSPCQKLHSQINSPLTPSIGNSPLDSNNSPLHSNFVTSPIGNSPLDSNNSPLHSNFVTSPIGNLPLDSNNSPLHSNFSTPLKGNSPLDSNNSPIIPPSETNKSTNNASSFSPSSTVKEPQNRPGAATASSTPNAHKYGSGFNNYSSNQRLAFRTPNQRYPYSMGGRYIPRGGIIPETQFSSINEEIRFKVNEDKNEAIKAENSSFIMKATVETIEDAAKQAKEAKKSQKLNQAPAKNRSRAANNKSAKSVPITIPQTIPSNKEKNIFGYTINFGVVPSSYSCTFPTTSVLAWWDYSSRYGLGYILYNGCVGVCFNDLSRIIMEPTEQFAQFYSRPNSEMQTVCIADYLNEPKKSEGEKQTNKSDQQETIKGNKQSNAQSRKTEMENKDAKNSQNNKKNDKESIFSGISDGGKSNQSNQSISPVEIKNNATKINANEENKSSCSPPNKKKILILKQFSQNLKKLASKYLEDNLCINLYEDSDELFQRMKIKPLHYIKYWGANKKDGILFRMNEKSIQASFTDKTSIYVCADTKNVIFDDSKTAYKVELRDVMGTKKMSSIQSKFLILKELEKKLE